MARAALALAAAAVVRTAIAAAAFSATVFVEEGGRVLVECDVRSSPGTNCTVANTGTYSLYPWADGHGRNVSAEKFNASHCACQLPPSDAESIALVQIPVGGGATVVVRFVALWTLYLSRAPYLSEDHNGSLLLRVHDSISDAKVSLVRADGSWLLKPTALQSGRAVEVPFPLGGLSPEVAFEELNVTLMRGKAAPLRRTVIIHRVRRPTQGTVVQMDYRRRGILVDGELLIGSGFYDSWTMNNKSNLTVLSKAGTTWAMRYLNDWNGTALVPWTATMIEEFMDAAASVGIKIMYPLHDLVEGIAGQGNSSGTWQQIASAIDKYKGHPALLGWYICDDCMTQWLIRQMHANVSTPTIDSMYRELKRLDPHHPFIGASESSMINVFTQPNVFVRGRSLDLVMLENYEIVLGGYAFLDGWGPTSFMNNWPLTQEPIVNCPAAWYPWDRTAYPEITHEQQGRLLYSFAWLAAVLGNRPYNMPFRLFPEADSVLGSADQRNTTIEEVGRFGRITRVLSDYLFQPPSSVPEPTLETVSPPSADTRRCIVCAAVWRLQDHEKFCAAVAVVNTLNVTTTATLRLTGAEQWPEASVMSLKRVDGVDVPGTRFVDGVFKLELAAYDTSVFATRDCLHNIFV